MNRYIACLKYGDKYSADYVNTLYSMTQRHTTLEHEFICMTENAQGLNPHIKVIGLETKGLSGWWYKPTFFSPNLGLDGTVLFIDLDVIIFNNIDKFFEYEPSKFCISRGFSKNNKDGMNSSCFRFDTNTMNREYDEFINNSESIMKRLDGDQDWMQETVKDYSFWPNNWIMSYKLDMVDKKHIKKVGNRFQINIEPLHEKETSIAAFHGEPNPHQIDNMWCKKHWR
jgi:hypothetical protein